jgi:hypothetical protein
MGTEQGVSGYWALGCDYGSMGGGPMTLGDRAMDKGLGHLAMDVRPPIREMGYCLGDRGPWILGDRAIGQWEWSLSCSD